MFLLETIKTVDITQEIPLKYWIIFIVVMAVILPLVSKLLTKLFIPAKGRDEAPIWSAMSKKNNRKRF
ncbi:MAG: hypothetical protein IJ362_02460 [Oscillospiraceae bacterium]|nr:hypothetical protein [Oscillospiraceae bacterium]